MKAPTNLIPALDLAGISQGNYQAIADAITALQQAHNDQAQALGQRIGSWIDVPYAASNFVGHTAGGVVRPWGVVAADQRIFRHIRIDDLLIVRFGIATAAVLVDADVYSLDITIPGGYIAHLNDWGHTLVRAEDNFVAVTAVAVTDGGSDHPSVIRCTLLSNANWSVTAGVVLQGTVLVQIANPSGN